MPKELHEIKTFKSGTIISPSERDIPEDAASYSLNLDSVTEDGKLKGIPKDKILTSSGFAEYNHGNLDTTGIDLDITEGQRIDFDGGAG